MVNKKFSGFTLVELLIVIIIIGILATMAIPQYQKMVDKAKFAEAWTNLNAIWKAEQIYYLQNNVFLDSFDQLDIDNPNNNPNRKFDYAYHTGYWVGVGSVGAGNDAHWQANGFSRPNGPNGACMLLHYSDGHVEKWLNYPWTISDAGWKKIE